MDNTRRWRYVESLSAYARQFIAATGKPDVDTIEGLSPSISIDQKTTNKKGCVVDIEGDITISTKINNGVFEKINDYKNTKGFIVARIKKKKWKIKLN